MASLLALSRAASEQAKRRLSLRLRIHLLTLALTLAAFWLPEPWVQLPVALAVITEAVAWWLRVSAQLLHDDAEQAKRVALLCNAFGCAESKVGADLRVAFSESVHKDAESLDDRGYYSSDEQLGTARLRDLVQESAFFSKHLYAAAAKRAAFIGVAPIVGLVAAIILAAPFSDPRMAVVIARVLVAFLALLISADILGYALAWNAGRALAERVDCTLERIDLASDHELLAAFADYGVVTSTTPPIPTGLYDKTRERLNQAWMDRKSKRGRQSG
jgi:hypothetical protein